MWTSFDQWQPQRNEEVLVWCGHDRCVKHIKDFRSEEASNNWLLWMPCPSPTDAEIVGAQRLRSLAQLSVLDQELELTYGLTGNPMIKAQERTPATLPPPNGYAPRGSGSTPVGGAGCATAGR